MACTRAREPSCVCPHHECEVSVLASNLEKAPPSQESCAALRSHSRSGSSAHALDLAQAGPWA
eukprot:14888091-Alexandrium_andersonii.AAC.1